MMTLFARDAYWTLSILLVLGQACSEADSPGAPNSPGGAGAGASPASTATAGLGGTVGGASAGAPSSGPATSAAGLAGAGTAGNVTSAGGTGDAGTSTAGVSAAGAESTNVAGSEDAGGSDSLGGAESTAGGEAQAGDGGDVSSGGIAGMAGMGGMAGMNAGDTGGVDSGGTGGTMGSGGADSGGTDAGGMGGVPPMAAGDCPDGIAQTIRVAKSGGDFTSVQAAIDSIPSGNSPTRIDIGPGTYTEKITIASRSNLCLVGEDPMTTILSYNHSNASVGSTSGSASVHVSADDFSAAHLTIENSYGSGSQAVALRLTGDRQQFYDCRFVGYQDTLYTHEGSQYFRDCYVQGNTDYVFGHATAILQNCEARNVEGGSAVVAPNTELSQSYGIIFLGGRFTAVSSIKSDSVALGRPWGQDGAAAYLNVELGAHIASEGFVEMSGNNPLNARFREYGSTGPGASPDAHPSYQMNATEAANYTVANVFMGWVPSYSQ